MWNHCGTRVGNARVILRAQREQLAIDEAKATAVTQNRMGQQAKLLATAQMALDKYKTVGSDTLNDKDWVTLLDGFCLRQRLLD
jgi:hypothetical protein